MNEREALIAILQTPSTPLGLDVKIHLRIQRSLLRRVWSEIAAAMAITAAFCAYLGTSWSTLWLDIQESSVLELGRLFWSDSDILVSNIQEMAWSIVEALPMESLLLGFIGVLFITVTIGLCLRLRELRRHEIRLT